MNVRALVLFACVLVALAALAEPAWAVRLAAVGLAVVVAGVLAEALRDLLRGVDAQPPMLAGVTPRSVPRSLPGELAELRRGLSWLAPEGPMPDAVFQQFQAIARRRVRRRLGLEPERPADHAALARELPAGLFTVVMTGLLRPPTERDPDARWVHGYVPDGLRPPMSALPALLDELERL